MSNHGKNPGTRLKFPGHDTSRPYSGLSYSDEQYCRNGIHAVRYFRHLFIVPFFLILIVILTACTTDSPATTHTPASPVELPQSARGTIELIAQAEHLSAPIFTETRNGTLYVWAGSEDGEARHFSRGVNGDSQIVALSADFPLQQELFAGEHGALMLWLDRTDTSIDLRLQAGTLNEGGIAVVGSVTVSDQRTRNYDAIAIDDEQIRIVWSGGLGEVTNLYLHHIDREARPISGDTLRINADYPAMIQDNEGIVHLFWLENNGRDAYHARFDDSATPVLLDIRRVASADVAGTDELSNFSAAFDGMTVYLFWNIRRNDDTRLVLMSSGQLTDERFNSPEALLTETGEAIQWLNPAQETQNPLPIVANQGENLLLLWMRDGELQESEWIVESGHLIGLPYIAETDSGLGLSWSQATGNGYANLLFVNLPR